MTLIQQITDAPLQQQSIILPDGTSLTLQIYYRPLQSGWFINALTYGTFVLNGLRITNSPNVLHQYRNQLPFGIGCFSVGNREPFFQQDFSSGASKLYILSAAEVAQYTEFLSRG